MLQMGISTSGKINTPRIQAVLDEWEQEVFEKENANMNWYQDNFSSLLSRERDGEGSKVSEFSTSSLVSRK